MSAVAIARDRVRSWISRLLDADPRDIATRLTLLLLVLYGEQYWDFKVPTVMVAALGMAAPGLARQWWFWLLLSVIQAIGLAGRLYTVDNHKVLMLYWTAALMLSMRSERTLAHNARLLVGLCFAFAAYWKAATHEFVDGSFLHFTMLTDDRFSNFAHIIGGVSRDVLAANKEAVAAVNEGRAAHAMLLDSAAIEPLAQVATWWTLFTESSIAVLFLLRPANWLLNAGRNAVLVGFIAMTYPIATVIGFGWLLTIMGYAQSAASERVARVAYLSLFLALQIYLIPWSQVVGL